VSRRSAYVVPLSIAVFVIASGLNRAQAPEEPPPAPPPMATVNGEAIAPEAWVSTLKAFWGAEALRDLIEERLIIQEAHRLGVTITATEIDQRITRMKADYPTDAAFDRMLRERGIGLNALKREVKREILLEKIVDRQAKVTDEDVKAYYDAHIEEYSRPTRVCLYAITTDERRDAITASERLLAGEDFSTVAADLSVDEHAAEGGSWGCLAAEELEPEAVRIAAFALEPGAQSEPIEADGKYYLLWAKERQPGLKVSLAEARSEIVSKLHAGSGITPEAVRRGIIRRANVSIQDPSFAFLQEEYEKAKQIQVVVDGSALDLDQAPVILESGRMVVPAKPVLEAIGASVEWFASTQTMRVRKGDTELLVAIGTPLAVVNEQQVDIDQPPVKRDGVLFVAPRWVVEQLGGSLLWSPTEYALEIKSTKGPEPDQP
jgi:parvulin-like peptidyl-prolyl isomerase